jgi:hypothetical protein
MYDIAVNPDAHADGPEDRDEDEDYAEDELRVGFLA